MNDKCFFCIHGYKEIKRGSNSVNPQRIWLQIWNQFLEVYQGLGGPGLVHCVSLQHTLVVKERTYLAWGSGLIFFVRFLTFMIIIFLGTNSFLQFVSFASGSHQHQFLMVKHNSLVEYHSSVPSKPANLVVKSIRFLRIGGKWVS